MAEEMLTNEEFQQLIFDEFYNGTDDTDENFEEMQQETTTEDEEIKRQAEAVNSQERTKLHQQLAQRLFIVSEDTIMDTIARLRCTECGRPANPQTLQSKDLMAGIVFKYECETGHKQTWASTPMYGGKSLIGQLTILAILLSGLTYHHIAQAAQFIKLSIPSASSFFQMQTIFFHPIQQYFKKHMNDVRAATNTKIVAIDTRFDSPGFSASKSTTAFVDYNSHKIIHVEFGDHRMTDRHAGAMERHNVERGLEEMRKMAVEEVVTDASSVIKSMMEQTENQSIFHSMDMWHKGKRIAELLMKAAKDKHLVVFRKWVRPIVNHFWFCCTTAQGSMNKLDRLWTSLVWHVQDIHEWLLGSCQHRLDQYAMSEPVLPQGSPAFEALWFVNS